MNRYRFVLHRPLQLVAVAFGISIVTFVLVHLIPGDPARTLLGTRLEPTLWLVTGSVVLSLLIALPLAAIAARQRDRLGDHPVRVASMLGMALPQFLLALMLIVCSVWFDVLPVSGYGASRGAKLAHLVLPSLTVAVSLAALLTRSLPVPPVRALDSDVAPAARARGMPESVVFWRHAMPNSLGQTINLLAVNAGWLLGGTVVVESVFALPGSGQLLVRGILARDYLATRGSIRVTPSC